MLKVPQLRRARGEMLPLMDMIFLLLVLFIFMIVQMRPDFGLTIELPESDVGGSATAPGQDALVVAVGIESDNKVYVNGTYIESMATLAAAVAALAEGERPMSILVQGDREADYGAVIAVYNVLRQAGHTDIVFETDPRK